MGVSCTSVWFRAYSLMVMAWHENRIEGKVIAKSQKFEGSDITLHIYKHRSRVSEKFHGFNKGFPEPDQVDLHILAINVNSPGSLIALGEYRHGISNDWVIRTIDINK